MGRARVGGGRVRERERERVRWSKGRMDGEGWMGLLSRTLQGETGRCLFTRLETLLVAVVPALLNLEGIRKIMDK